MDSKLKISIKDVTIRELHSHWSKLFMTLALEASLLRTSSPSKALANG